MRPGRSARFLLAFAVACAMFLPLLRFTAPPPAHAAIGFVKNIGTNAEPAIQMPYTSITVTVPAGGVAAGDSIIVTFAMMGFITTSAVLNATDSAGNSYNLDVFH